MRIRTALFAIILGLGLLGGTASPASAAPDGPASAVVALEHCNGYQPYAYPPIQNGDVIRGIGGCGFRAVTVEVWKDVPGFDQRVGCCPFGNSPVTAYAYCSRSGHGNYYTVARTPLGTIESDRRTLC